jgi:hypothetical protein
LRANLSGGSRPGGESDHIAYFRSLPKLGKLPPMKKDPLSVRLDPAVAERGIPFDDPAGKVRNHRDPMNERGATLRRRLDPDKREPCDCVDSEGPSVR